MKGLFFILLLILLPAYIIGQELSDDSFRWGNAFYINLRVGEKTTFNQTEIRLISVFNQFNTLKIGNDTFVVKVSRQTLPVSFDKFRIFVADNRFLKEKSANPEAHGLLKKDVLLCLSQTNNRLLDPVVYKFPVDFTDGFQWSAEEETQMFSFFFQKDGKGLLKCYTHQGIDFDLNDARMQEKHLIVALENSTVVWTEQNKPDQNKYEAAVLLRSESDPGIFYVYEHLNNRKLYVRKGQKINKGDEVGYSWGNSNWGNLQFSVIRSDTVPSYYDRFRNLVNCFPQLFELYTGTLAPMQKATSKGSIDFGRPEPVSGNIKNTLAYEDFSGRGWLLNKWNPADRVESASKGLLGNARLRKTLFRETTIACTDPDNFYDYEINVSPGVYRVRAEVGDAEEASWQKVEFEGVSAGIIELPACIFKWTTERAVKVVDGKLTVRIYFSPDKVAGLSTLVFQKAY